MSASRTVQAMILVGLSLGSATFSLADESPTISIQQPLNEAHYLAPAFPGFRVATYVPDAVLTQVDLFANEAFIGTLSDCPADGLCADPCGSPTPGSLVRLKFYPVELREPWEFLTLSQPGEYTIRLTREDHDTGALSFGDQVTIQVGARLTITSDPELQLKPLAVLQQHRIESSTNLIDWTPLELPTKTTEITLDPSASPTQFFRLAAP